MMVLDGIPRKGKFKVTYHSFPETQLRTLRNSLRGHLFFGGAILYAIIEKKLKTPRAEIWLVEIACGILIAFFIMNG